jgi:hypothetical protein
LAAVVFVAEVRFPAHRTLAPFEMVTPLPFTELLAVIVELTVSVAAFCTMMLSPELLLAVTAPADRMTESSMNMPLEDAALDAATVLSATNSD